MDRDLRLNLLLRELDHRDVRLRLEHGRLHVQRGDKLTAELCDEITELRAELVEYLRTQGEEVVDYTAGDAEAKSRSGMRTPPRTTAEVEADARSAQAASAKRREYQGGMVVVHNHDGLTGDRGRNGFARHVELLVRERDHRAAVERGEIPPAGRYVTRFNVFG